MTAVVAKIKINFSRGSEAYLSKTGTAACFAIDALFRVSLMFKVGTEISSSIGSGRLTSKAITSMLLLKTIASVFDSFSNVKPLSMPR